MRRDPIYTGRARDLRANATEAEKRMWSILRAKRMGGFKFRRQHALGQYIADFICLPARLVIEVDGDTHDDMRLALDERRTEYIERLGYRVIRFWNSDVLNSSNDIASAIAEALGIVHRPRDESFSAGSDPSPWPSPLQGEGNFGSDPSPLWGVGKVFR
jgi:very-short-patch-repair endonuclease